MKPAMLIRCDASTEVGLGHLMRCLALGGALRDDGVGVAFAMRAPSSVATSEVAAGDFVLHQLDDESGAFDAEAGRKLAMLMRDRGIATVLVDHYSADDDYFFALADSAKLVCAIDDQATRRFEGVRWLLNPNPTIAASEYKIDPHAELLIGPKYALLRSAFANARTEQSKPAEGPAREARILIQFGGGNTDALCARTIVWLQGVSQPCEVRCILVDGDPSHDAAMRAGHHRVSVLRSVSSMAEHMQWADFSIGAGGSTCWELCCLGVPMIAGELSPDQSHIVTVLEQQGAAINLGKWQEIDSHRLVDVVQRMMANPKRLRRMSVAGMALVDGQGARRASRSLVKCMTRAAEVVA